MRCGQPLQDYFFYSHMIEVLLVILVIAWLFGFLPAITSASIIQFLILLAIVAVIVRAIEGPREYV